MNSRITELVGDLADRDRRRENEQREQARNIILLGKGSFNSPRQKSGLVHKGGGGEPSVQT